MNSITLCPIWFVHIVDTISVNLLNGYCPPANHDSLLVLQCTKQFYQHPYAAASLNESSNYHLCLTIYWRSQVKIMCLVQLFLMVTLTALYFI